MADVLRWLGNLLDWRGLEVQRRFEREAIRRLHRSVKILKDRVIWRLSARGSDTNRSRPGQSPFYQTGYLQRSVFATVDEKKLEGRVGITAEYGLWLEFGTQGGTVVYARPGGVLSWIDRDTGERRFAKSVVLGAILPRPFLRPALAEARQTVLPAWMQPIPLEGGGGYLPVGPGTAA